MRTPSSLTRIASLATIIAMAASSLAASPAAARDYEGATPAGYVEIGRMPLQDGEPAIPDMYLIIDNNGKQVTNAIFREVVVGGKRYSVAFRPITIDGVGIQWTCQATNAPAPTYSWSNHTMHFGVNGTCSLPFQMPARTSLWSGPSYNSANIWQAKSPTDPFRDWDYGTGAIFSGAVRSCVDWGGFAWWDLLMFVEALVNGAWTPFVPYPGSSKKENECKDVV